MIALCDDGHPSVVRKKMLGAARLEERGYSEAWCHAGPAWVAHDGL